MKDQVESDVVIIGGGITGAGIAREISRYKIETLLVEKSESISDGQTKSTIIPLYRGVGMLLSIFMKSFILKPGESLYDPTSRRAKFEEDSWKIWHEEWIPELDMHHKPLGTLMVAKKERLENLDATEKLGKTLGGQFAEIERVDRDFILEREPNLSKDLVAGLCATSNHTTQLSPWEAVMALLENAQQNGVKVMRGAEVIGISSKGDIQIVETTKGAIKTRFIVNAAGAYADRIAAMGGEVDWKVVCEVGGATCLFDKQASAELVSGNNYLTFPGETLKQELFISTVEGNLLVNWGGYSPTDNKSNTAVTYENYRVAISGMREMMPEISGKDIIRAYNSVRAFHTRDPEEHIIEPCSTNPRLINAKVRLPGFIVSPGVARYVIQLLGDAGLELTTDAEFNPYRKAIPRFRDLSDEERRELIARDPRYGHVVCRCETVTEGEIVKAIKRGAQTIQDVKFMTRSGMGRCQGGFCRPRVMQILSRELDIPVTSVLERNCPVVLYESKELMGAAGSVM